jgi:parallel beta-helix repeat protein
MSKFRKGRPPHPLTYVIYQDGASYVAEPDRTLGLSEFADTDFASLIANIQEQLKADGSIFVKAGTYKLTTEVIVTTQYLRITGEGEATILQPDSAINAIRVQANNCEIDHLYIKHAENDTGYCIYVDSNCNGTYIHDNRCDNGKINIYSINAQNYLVIENNYVSGGGYGEASIDCINSSGNPSKRLIIRGNNIINATGHAVQVYASTPSDNYSNDVECLDNFIDTPSQAGIFFAYVDRGSIRGNKVISNSYEGIDIESCNNIIMESNIVRDSLEEAIKIAPAGAGIAPASEVGRRNTNIQVTGNNVSSSGGSACIYVDGTDVINVVDNICNAYGGEGIHATNSLTGVTVIGNNLNNNNNINGISHSHGIRIDLGNDKTIDDLIISDNRCKGFHWGISLLSGKIINSLIRGNNVTGNINGAIRYGPAVVLTYLKAVDNLGYNPQAPNSITPSGSPYLFQNTYGYPQDIIISSGLVSLIEWSQNGAEYYELYFTTNQVVHLEVNEYLRITYSLQPTIVRKPY